MVVPLYISEVSFHLNTQYFRAMTDPDIGLHSRNSRRLSGRATVLASVPRRRNGNSADLCPVSVTIGILASYWIDYGTHYIGGSRCAPNIPYTGGVASKPTFDPYQDIPAGGCTGQSEVSWRLPLAIQIIPAIILGAGMVFFPDSPRWLMMKERDDDSISALSRLRRQDRDSPALQIEYLEIRASIMLENTFAREHFPNLSGWKLHAAQVRTPKHGSVHIYTDNNNSICRS